MFEYVQRIYQHLYALPSRRLPIYLNVSSWFRPTNKPRKPTNQAQARPRPGRNPIPLPPSLGPESHHGTPACTLPSKFPRSRDQWPRSAAVTRRDGTHHAGRPIETPRAVDYWDVPVWLRCQPVRVAAPDLSFAVMGRMSRPVYFFSWRRVFGGGN